MTVSYDVFTEAFLNKITEYKLANMFHKSRSAIVDNYMKMACSQFGKICKYNIMDWDDETRSFELDGISQGELYEIVDIVSDGMLVQWMKPYMYMQNGMELMLVTTDHSLHSQAELLGKVKSVYQMCERNFVARIREYSYAHGDLKDMHI